MTNLLNKTVKVNTYKGNMKHVGKVIKQANNTITILKDNSDTLKFLVGLDKIEVISPQTLEEKFVQALQDNNIKNTNGHDDLYIFESEHGLYDVWVSIIDNEYFELSTLNKDRRYHIKQAKKENMWHESSYDDLTNETTRKTVNGAINYIKKYLGLN